MSLLEDDDRLLLEDAGWTVDCESPLEVSHPDGSSARGVMPVAGLLMLLREEASGETDYDRGYHDGEQGTYDPSRREE